MISDNVLNAVAPRHQCCIQCVDYMSKRYQYIEVASKSGEGETVTDIKDGDNDN